jgi:uncharacterized membrane protein YoaK (UPF0700 family)
MAALTTLIAAALLLGAPVGAEGGPGGFRGFARITSERENRFTFVSRLASVLFDASILIPLTWLQSESSPRVSVVSLVGFGAAYLVAYELARGQGVGYRGWESVPYRTVTAALLVVAVFGARFEAVVLEVSLWAFAILSVGAAVKRGLDVAGEERESAAATGAPV